ncbi:hypothetical protein HELRODRAFT_185121 [Helobdella robusta]|uniref:Retinol dehydrogenase 14 n=1 Tax=Helobdella robusta TaxID=6412 RepID=T1FMF4_HELRO|nr:hypothetical protein HELRODRAFT_185121 [Helobdella robusta]ESN94573.1 hypothetical protein HELRODRAFT_185121 [Helobdella robusta]
MWKWVLIGVAGLGIVLIRRRMAGGKCRSKASMINKTVIITGANCGIGRATAFELARRHSRVILACRDVEVGLKVAQEITQKHEGSSVIVKKLDLASFSSIRSFAADINSTESRVDVLINNAGVYHCPFLLTEDGLETQMGVNHFGHFLLTNLLLNKLKSSAPSRIVIVSSGLGAFGSIDLENINSEKSYDKSRTYNNSKLANNLFARELSRRLENTGVSVYCLRPGMVRSKLGRHVEPSWIMKIIFWPISWLLVKSCYEGCQTVVYCSVDSQIEGVNGKFYADCHEEPWNEASNDLNLAQKLWLKSEKLTKLYN